jgi:hypothetical protein
MKNSSIKRNYLFGVGGGLAAVLLSACVSPAFAAAQFTDDFGNMCNFSDLIPGGPNGDSICPASFGPHTPQQQADAERNARQLGLGRLIAQQARQQQMKDDIGNFVGLGLGGGIGAQSSHLGMYVNGGTTGDVTLDGGGFSLRNSGASISDTAGLIAPGTNSASYRDNGGGGGISGMYDASRFVGPNQKLGFFGAFDYTSSKTNFGGIGAGSAINSDSYSFTGAAVYENYNTYLALKGSYQFGNNSEFDSSSSSSGNYNSDGYDIDAQLGHVFFLYNTIAQPAPSRMALKASAKAADGYAIGLDLSGHLGYASNVARGFTDNSGFVFGDERAQGGETGLNAKLFADIPRDGVTWRPYVSGSVDWRFSYSHVADFPVQLALATGDAVSYADATTFVGATAGLDVKMTNGWTVGANGFYQHSSDTEIVGGKAYVKIPFGETAVTARY